MRDTRFARRLLADERGQDLIEYALLLGIVTVGFITVMPSIQTKMANAFSAWGSGVQDLWVPNNPTP